MIDTDLRTGSGGEDRLADSNPALPPSLTSSASPMSESLMSQHAELVRAVVISRIIRRLGEVGDPTSGSGWLDDYAAQLALGLPSGLGPAETEQWWIAALGALEARLTPDAPLRRLERDDALLVTAVGLIEEDIRFGSLFAALQAPLVSRRPCVGLLGWLLAGPGQDRELATRCQELARRGVVQVTNTDDPRAEWVVKVPIAVWELLQTGRVTPQSLPAGLRLHPAAEFPTVEQVWVGADAAAQVKTLITVLAAGQVSAVVLRGLARSGRRTLLGAAARALGWDVVVCDRPVGVVCDRPVGVVCDRPVGADESWRTLGALASLGSVLPVVRCQPSYDQTLVLPPLPALDRPLGIVIGPTGGLAGDPMRQPVTIVLPPCDRDGRRLLWMHAGLDPERDHVDDIVDSFLLTPGNVTLTAALARTTAAAENRTWVTAEDVRVSTGQLHRQQLEPMAVRLDPLTGPRPILGATADEELETLLLRCRYREQLAAGGVSDNIGVRTLFSGPSGTGKTLAARYLAACLSLDIYRVNLATVVNKYIGETEANLDRVLSTAEELGVVLLLDEGDSLMAKRTDVNDANDRYANLETNYLLQRFETFSGVVVVTSNAAGRIDPAFLRRIDVTVDFLPPTAEQRWLIWAAHLPPAHQVSETLLTDLARRCPLTGGVIRNVALHAHLLALDSARPLDDDHLLAALRREYRRSGGSYPLGDSR